MSDTALVAIVALFIAFLLPAAGQWGPANAVYSVTRAPLVSWEEDFNRLFAGLPARRPLPYRIWGDAMAFQGTINPTDTPVLQVNSPVPLYWKARSYATYTHEGWLSDGTVLKEPGWQPAPSAPSPEQKRFNVTFEVVPNYASRSVFAGGQVIGSNRDIRIETFDSPKYVIDPHVDSPTADLPATLAQAVEGIRGAVQDHADASDHAIASALPTSFLLESVERGDDGSVVEALVAETVPSQPDVLAVRTSRGSAESGRPLPGYFRRVQRQNRKIYARPAMNTPRGSGSVTPPCHPICRIESRNWRRLSPWASKPPTIKPRRWKPT